MKTNTKTFEQLAIIGSTASGKTSLSIKLAQQMNATVLSLDSLAIYKEMDIVSAKPTVLERKGITHFGLDYIYPDEPFDVNIFIQLYHEAYNYCKKHAQNLIIVGGTGFYLKMLIEGISPLPSYTKDTYKKVSIALKSLQEAYSTLYTIDKEYMSYIDSHDKYRIEKALLIYTQTGLTPTEYFQQNPPQSTIHEHLTIYQIVWDRQKLRERITQRTKLMLQTGLIDEITCLEKKYTRASNPMQAIGVKETLAYLDGKYDKKMLIEKITTNTVRLAKRQNTFNNSQFDNVIKGNIEELKKRLL